MELKPFKTSLTMPNFKPLDVKKVQKDALAYDQQAYNYSDADFKRRHGLTLEAEKLFENQTLEDQKGENALAPALQNEFMRSGLTGALKSVGTAPGSLAPGSAGEASVARNLGLKIMDFQDRNRENRQKSLTLAENLFPRRDFGISGGDAAQVMAANSISQNNWNQANYADNLNKKMFNYRIKAENLRGDQMTANAQAQGAAAEDAANTQAIAGGATALAGLALLAFVCWVARAAYGEQAREWGIFRNWLLRDAPVWLRSFYIRHGERIAKVVERSNALRAITRFFMNHAITIKRREWTCSACA